VLDHSYYLNKEDFEIEYEVSNREKGLEVFSELLLNLDIPIRKTDNKIMRFYKEKYNQQAGF
ncbi:CYTH domain-containing protein, partial [Bacillus sp. JJ1532]